MGRFARKYPAEQIEACALAVVDGEKLYGRRVYPRDAVAMALAGELHGHGHFEITKAVVQKAAGKLRKERTGQAIKQRRESKKVEDRVEAMTLQLIRINEAALDRLEQRVKRGDTADAFEQVKKAGLAIREIEARKVPPSSHTGRGARKSETDPPKPTVEESDVIKRMRAAMDDEHEPNGNGGGRASAGAGAAGDGAEAGQAGPTVAGTVAT